MVLSWGYNVVSEGDTQYAYEYALMNEISGLIDEARNTLDVEFRRMIYTDALDLIMEMSVILPTYQRKEMLAYNVECLQEGTLKNCNWMTPLYEKLWQIDYN